MARTQAQIQADIDALLAIPAGVEQSAQGDKRVTFSSEDMRAKALARLKRELTGGRRVSYVCPR